MRFVIIIGFVLVASYWASQAARDGLRNAVASHPRVFLTTGLKLHLGPGLKVIRSSGSVRPHDHEGRRLVIVTSDACPFSKKLLPRWDSLLQSTAFRPTDSVDVVSYVGFSMAERLADEVHGSGEVTVFKVEDAVLFSSGTGLVKTPMTLAVDERGTVSYVPVALDEREAKDLRVFFSDERHPVLTRSGKIGG